MEFHNKKRTLLISAYACEPIKGSEPAVGWNWVLQLAKGNLVHVITRSNNQKSIEENLPAELASSLFFHYYDTNRFIRNLKKRDKGLYFYNLCWQIGLLPLAKKIIRQNKIDYTIHLTFGSMWMPTFLPLLDPPFIWGPIGGGECIPKSFLKVMPFSQKIVQSTRFLLNATTILNPFVLLPCYKATVVLARTPNTSQAIPKWFRSKTEVVLETAMASDVFAYHKTQYDNPVVKMVISARLIAIKNILTVIKSLEYLPVAPQWQLTIIGSGPQEKTIHTAISKNKYQERISVVPFMPRMEALKEIEGSDILIFPSLKEGGSWALMEAMAIGLPVVCLNWAGMAVSTDEKSAIQLPVTTPDQMPKDMANAIIRLIENPELRRQMGEAGRERIRTHFNWEAKGEFMESLFHKIEHK